MSEQEQRGPTGKIFGYIPADEMHERMAGLKRQGEERKALEAKWRAEWEVKDRRERVAAAHVEATKHNLYKPTKPLTVGQLRKWLSQWHRDTPVYYYSHDYDGDRWEEPVTYGDVILKKDDRRAVPARRVVIGD